MALVSTIYPPEIWANESLMVLRDRLVMARLVHRDFENEVAQRGDMVRTRKPTKLTARTWSGQSATLATSTISIENLNAKGLSISLDTIKYTSFIVEDRDAATSIKALRDEFVVPALDPIAQAVDDDIMTEFTSSASTDVDGNAITAIAYDTVGLGADMNEDDVVTARHELNSAQCPVEGRVIVLSADHEADLLRSDLFTKANEAGSSEALINANLGRKFGFDFYLSQNVPAASDTDSTPQSLAFHRNVLSLVVRPLPSIPAGLGAESAVRNIDDISVRVTTCYEQLYKGVVVSFDILYGVQLLDAHLGRILNP